MIFKKAQVTNVTANIGKGEIKLTFSVALNEMLTANELASYIDREAGKVTLDIMPWQLAMLKPKGATGMDLYIQDDTDVSKNAVGVWHEAGSVPGDPD